MGQASTSDFRPGMKVEVDKEPFVIVDVEFVKPGKGQAFTRVKLKHLLSGRILKKTYKSGAKIDLADVEEVEMRMLYSEGEEAFFMDDKTFDQIGVPLSVIKDKQIYLMEDTLYTIIFCKKVVVDVIPPLFMEMKIVETDPGLRGDTASGRALKMAKTETGAKIQVPLFIQEGEMIKVDTRSGEYVSRV